MLSTELSTTTKSSIIDIIMIEYSLGTKILCDNNAEVTTISIYNTCKLFNELTKEKNIKEREEYYKILLPKKIEETIEKKMFAILNNPKNVNVYKTPEEYEEDLLNLSLKINDYNYSHILENMIELYKDNAKEYYIYDNNRHGRYHMFYILMNEYYSFINKHMKHKINKGDFLKEDDEEVYKFIMDDEDEI